MTEAYDLAVLVGKLKARGLDVAEDAAKGLIEDVFAWAEESARLSATPFDDVALVVLPKAKDLALKAADKLDGQPG